MSIPVVEKLVASRVKPSKILTDGDTPLKVRVRVELVIVDPLVKKTMGTFGVL